MASPVVLWLLSVQLFAAIVYIQKGSTSEHRSHILVLNSRLTAFQPQPARCSSPAACTCPSSAFFLKPDVALITDHVYSQIEYMIIALLLKSSGLTALIVAYIGGTVLFAAQLFIEDRESDAGAASEPWEAPDMHPL